MKKILLSFVSFIIAFSSTAQIIVYIQEPASAEGNLEFTWSGNWATDLLDPNNSITGELVFVTDGTFQDSLGCNTLTNANELASKVAGLEINAAGSGYSSGENIATLPTETGSGAGLTVNITANAIGAVLSFDDVSLNPGSDYDDADGVETTTNGNGMGLTVNILTDDGAIVSIEINEQGSGYVVGDIITITGGNLDATIEVAEVGNGEITSVSLNEIGNNYKLGDTLTVSGGNENALIIVSDIDGKIAVVYRGECQFGEKSLNAQVAGAIGVIIINNIPGPPVGMAPGDVGANVNIPVVMISDVAGANLRNQIIQGGVIAFIGNKSLFYENDLGIFSQDILRPKSASTLNILAQEEGELTFKVGATVNNYGRSDQTNISLVAKIFSGADTIYSHTSDKFNLVSGAELFVLLPDADLANVSNGHYTLKYSILSPIEDDFIGDNQISTPLYINDNLFSYSRVNPENNRLIRTDGYRSTTATNNFDVCMVFRHAKASRLGVKGMWFSAVTNEENSLIGEFIMLRFVKWNDNFQDLDDNSLDVSNMEIIATGEYNYFDDEQGVSVYAEFDDVIALEDNQRYLACASTFSENIFFGFDSGIDYTKNVAEYRQPLSPIVSNTNWAMLGFGENLSPALGLHLFDIETISVKEVADAPEIKPYPNPAKDLLNIPFSNEKKGMADLQVYDITGKMVSNERVNITSNSIKTYETNILENGSYIFRVIYDDGSNTSFKVLISK